MIVISRRNAARFRTVLKRCALGRSRGSVPRLIVEQNAEGVTLFAALDEAALSLRTSTEPGPLCRMVVPLSQLEEIEAKSADDTTLEPLADGRIRCRWNTGGVPHDSCWQPAANDASVEPWVAADAWAAMDPSLLQALHECGRSTAKEHTRYALNRLQLRGSSSQVAGTDARQLFLWGGFDLPFRDNLLVPAVPVFGSREFAGETDIGLARTADHVVVAIGPWTVWLAIDKESRFPDVASIIPRRAATQVHLDEADRIALAEALPRWPKGDSDVPSVTWEIGPRLVVRCKAEHGVSEIRLSRSSWKGDETVVVLNRNHLIRALTLGLCEVRVASDEAPVVFRQDQRAFVTMTLSPRSAVSASSEPVAAITNEPDSFQPGGTPMPSDHPGRNGGTEPAEEPIDFIAEAEALRDALSEVARRASRLVVSLRQLQKQRRVLATAWSSLKNLRLGP